MGSPNTASKILSHRTALRDSSAALVGSIPLRAGSFTLQPKELPASTVRRSIVLEADDLGLVYAFNEGIRQAYLHGRLTSTCIRANGYAYDHAIHDVLPSCPGLGVGVHLCLNEAECVAPREKVSLLLGSDGRLRTGYVWLMKLVGTSAGRRQIECEFRAQIEKVLSDGAPVDHLNSHQHVHMIPAIFRITCRLAREYKIACVRLVRELPYGGGGLRKKVQPLVNSNYIKHVLLNHFARLNESAARRFGVPTTDYFIGVNYTAHMNINTVLNGLRATPCGSVEILLHPAIWPDRRDIKYPHAAFRKYISAPQRAAELHALKVPELTDFLQRETWMPTNFAEWAQAQRDCQPQIMTPEIPDAVRGICKTAIATGPPWVSAAQDDSRVFAELVISQAEPGQRVLDVGTGTGIIAICVAKAGRDVTGIDISRAAVRTAKANAKRNGASFECYQSELLSSVQGRFDLIAFNPPYNFGPDTFASNLAKNLLRRIPFVRRTSGLAMPRTVLRFHQRLIERLIRQAPEHLRPGGRILIHAYESEVAALSSVLPAGAVVELLDHPALSNSTVGMMIRLKGN